MISQLIQRTTKLLVNLATANSGLKAIAALGSHSTFVHSSGIRSRLSICTFKSATALSRGTLAVIIVMFRIQSSHRMKLKVIYILIIKYTLQ